MFSVGRQIRQTAQQQSRLCFDMLCPPLRSHMHCLTFSSLAASSAQADLQTNTHTHTANTPHCICECSTKHKSSWGGGLLSGSYQTRISVTVKAQWSKKHQLLSMSSGSPQPVAYGNITPSQGCLYGNPQFHFA